MRLRLIVVLILTLAAASAGPVMCVADASGPSVLLAHDRHWHEDDGMEGRACCSGCAAVFLVIPFLFFCSSVALAVWIYQDAHARKLADAPLWAMLGAFTNVFGLFIYLNARPRNFAERSS